MITRFTVCIFSSILFATTAAHAQMPSPPPPGNNMPAGAPANNAPDQPSMSAEEIEKAKQNANEAAIDKLLEATKGQPEILDLEQEKQEPWLTELGNTKYQPLPTSSIFFTDAEVKTIGKLLYALQNKGEGNLLEEFLPEDDPIQDIIKESEVKKVRAKPIFFLSSLMYFSPTHWTAWISGKKLTAKNPKLGEELEVLSASRYSLLLAWQPEDLADITLQFESQDNEEQAPDHMLSHLGKGVEIGDDGRILIRLRANQSFYGHDLKIREGLPFRDTSLAEQFFWPPKILGETKPDESLANQPIAPMAPGQDPSREQMEQLIQQQLDRQATQEMEQP